MVCKTCGCHLEVQKEQCPYCGSPQRDVILLKRQKKVLVWVWSLAFFFFSLSVFVLFGEEIFHFVDFLQHRFDFIEPLFVCLRFLHIS